MIQGNLEDTPPKFNIAPEKSWFEDYFPIGKVTFQGRAVKLREGIFHGNLRVAPGNQWLKD